MLETVTITADKYLLIKATEIIKRALPNLRHCANMADRSSDMNRELREADELECIAKVLSGEVKA